MERLTELAAQQQRIIAESDAKQSAAAREARLKEDRLRRECAEFQERTQVAEDKLVRRDLDTQEREHNRRRGATVRGLSEAVATVDEFLDEVETAQACARR